MNEIRYAILIGINDYKEKELRYCDNDVIQLKKRLVKNCLYLNENVFDIVSTSDTSIEELWQEVKNTIDTIRRSFVANDDSILFYFSGHGRFEKEQTYLEFHEDKVATQTIFDLINALKPANQIYIIDACHSGFGIEFKSRADDDAMQMYYHQRYIAGAEGVYFMCSCKQDEKSQAFPKDRNGVFTKYIIEAIDNTSIYDSDNKSLSIPTIFEYTLKKILLTGRYQQTPFIQIQASGYYPFAMKIAEDFKICEFVTETFINEGQIEDFLRREDLNLEPDLRRDLFHFCSELALNHFGHGFAPKLEISIVGNSVNISDYSAKAFNPFIAQPTPGGKGIKIIQKFMERYRNVCNFSFSEGKPNIISLTFSNEIRGFNLVDPCFIIIDRESTRYPQNLNQIDIDNSCKELVIDATNAFIWGSMGQLFLDYLIRRTDEARPFIILKLHKNDFTKEYLIPMTHLERYSRILIV